jgi:hypothetical protein
MTQATVRLQPAAADALSPGWERNLISVAAWRKRVGVEPTGDGVTRHPPVLKNTRGVLIGYENFRLYLIL